MFVRSVYASVTRKGFRGFACFIGCALPTESPLFQFNIDGLIAEGKMLQFLYVHQDAFFSKKMHFLNIESTPKVEVVAGRLVILNLA